MKHLYLCRHGETSWNAERRIQGRTDIELNECGLEQARKLADFFVREQPKADIVVCSPMKRAFQTAECVASVLGLECRVDEDLTEIHTGEFTGRKLDELSKEPMWLAHLEDPWNVGYGEYGETAEHVRERMIRAIGRYDRAIVVSHASPIRHVLLYLFDIPFYHLYHLCIENAAATYVTVRDTYSKLMYLNKV